MKKKNKSLMTILFLITTLSSSAQETGIITDARDDQTYKTVKIGEQTWMSENFETNGWSRVIIRLLQVIKMNSSHYNNCYL